MLPKNYTIIFAPKIIKAKPFILSFYNDYD